MTSLGFDNDTIAESPVIQIATTVANSGSLASLFWLAIVL